MKYASLLARLLLLHFPTLILQSRSLLDMINKIPSRFYIDEGVDEEVRKKKLITFSNKV